MPEQGAALRAIAQDTFTTLGLDGLVRVDFRVTERGNAVIIDYNNSPHVTEFHSCARAVMDLGFEYGDMLCLLLYKHIVRQRLA
jgi:D-alanine-D-alanine ligase-like ATP-grasp enzyme